MATEAPSATDGLQFERAHFDGGSGAQCAACRRPIYGVYFQVNGLVACEACRYRVDIAPPGSRGGRVARAAALGALAAAGGSALYYAVSAITGYEFGLIAIVVGVLVGKAVRKGSAGRGGWAYQALAMFLTYASIVSTYIPPILKEVAGHKPKSADTATAHNAAAPAASTASAEAAPAAMGTVATAPVKAEASPLPRTPGRIALTLTLALVFLFALAFAAPFLAGIQNAMGLVIIAIGLYEAWKMNRRLPIVIAGPYRVGAGGAPAGD